MTKSSIKHIYTLKPGENWAIYKTWLVITHPDRLPFIIHADGTIEEIKP